jgi:hypothetical protein
LSELELLYVVLVLIYGWESSCWVRRGSLLLISWLGRGWRLAHPSALLGNQTGGFRFAPPLPPLGTVLQAVQFPLSIDADAVLAYVSSAINPAGRGLQTGRMIRFSDIQNVQARSRKVYVNKQLLVRTGSKRLAISLAQKLEALKKISKKEREKTLAESERLDTGGIEKRWKQFQETTRTLRLLCNLLFVYLFVAAPAILWQFGLEHNWLPLLIGLLGMTTGCSILFRQAHLALYPGPDEERFTHTLTILLSPATAIRARDILSRPLLEEFHPLVVAKVFCSAEQFQELARFCLREVRHPAKPWSPNPDRAASQVEAQARERLRASIEKFIKSSGLDPEKLDGTPERTDASCMSYCPRCLSQFTARSGVCEDCGGLELVPFPESRQAQPNAVSLSSGERDQG